MHRSTKYLLINTLLTVEELSKYLGVKPATIKQWAYRGKIDFIKKGNQLLFDKRDYCAKRQDKIVRRDQMRT